MFDKFEKLATAFTKLAENVVDTAFQRIMSDSSDQSVYPAELDLPGGLRGIIIHELRLGLDNEKLIEPQYHQYPSYSYPEHKREHRPYNKYDIVSRPLYTPNLGLEGYFYRGIFFDYDQSSYVITIDSTDRIKYGGFGGPSDSYTPHDLREIYNITFNIPHTEWNTIVIPNVAQSIVGSFFNYLQS